MNQEKNYIIIDEWIFKNTPINYKCVIKYTSVGENIIAATKIRKKYVAI